VLSTSPGLLVGNCRQLALIGKWLILSKMLKILVPFCDEDFQESIDYQLVDDHTTEEMPGRGRA
jgi:hypothetical protein